MILTRLATMTRRINFDRLRARLDDAAETFLRHAGRKIALDGSITNRKQFLKIHQKRVA
jgi:hypothetical protein